MDIDINLLRDNLNNKLKDSGWDRMLSPYVNGLSFDYIMNKLRDSVEQGLRFTPKFKDVFNGFYECPYDNLKVVIVGQDPYPQLGVADGIAFSCSIKGKAEKSLQYILKALEDEDGSVDLRRWSNQGVLLINTAFTCEVNKIGSHYGIWKSFTEHVFENINRHNPDTIFILMGKKAEAWQTLLPNCKIIKCSHPASAAYRGGEWDCNDVFNKTNTMLIKQDKTCINW
jgi:uracil-DNA glycosylase|tara:strand:+ start:985 stop:1665 length:681 start_codon:yes stop_codon:yes gene_type:complete